MSNLSIYREWFRPIVANLLAEAVANKWSRQQLCQALAKAYGSHKRGHIYTMWLKERKLALAAFDRGSSIIAEYKNERRRAGKPIKPEPAQGQLSLLD